MSDQRAMLDDCTVSADCPARMLHLSDCPAGIAAASARARLAEVLTGRSKPPSA